MSIFDKNNTVLMGLLIGVSVPVLGYIGVESLFAVLTEMGVMDEVTSSSGIKRKRTLALIGICANIIPVQYAKRFRWDKIINGILLATLIFAGLWILYFRSSLFSSF